MKTSSPIPMPTSVSAPTSRSSKIVSIGVDVYPASDETSGFQRTAARSTKCSPAAGSARLCHWLPRGSRLTIVPPSGALSRATTFSRSRTQWPAVTR